MADWLSWLIPTIIIGVLVILMFEKIREPMLSFFGWLRDMFTRGKDNVKDRVQDLDPMDSNIIYR